MRSERFWPLAPFVLRISVAVKLASAKVAMFFMDMISIADDLFLGWPWRSTPPYSDAKSIVDRQIPEEIDHSGLWLGIRLYRWTLERGEGFRCGKQGQRLGGDRLLARPE